MLRKHVQSEVLKLCHSLYWNPWFLIKRRTTEKCWLINVTMKMNKVIIHNANMSLSVNKFSENFAECVIVSLIDFFLRYDQIELNEACQDTTVFMTCIELLRMKILSQEAINSVAQFIQIVSKILKNHISVKCWFFLDDIEIKELKTKYQNQEIISEIQQFILEHVQWLNAVLADLKWADCIMSEKKSQFCMSDIKIVEFVCNAEEWHLNSTKMIKVLNWKLCMNVVTAHSFLELCIYYHIWIKNFTLVMKFIYWLMKKNIIFKWTWKQQAAMNSLKTLLMTVSALCFIDYENEEDIILIINASLQGWSTVLMQVNKKIKKWHLSWYESDLWTELKQNYNVGKQKCWVILKTLKKVQFWLYKVQFILKMNANILVAQLNWTVTDLSDALIIWWIVWIQLFDFNIQHISEHKHITADALFWRSCTESDDIDEWHEVDINKFIDAELNLLQLVSVQAEIKKKVLKSEYFKDSLAIAWYLTTLCQSSELLIKKFSSFKNNVLKFLIKDWHLFQWNERNESLQHVVNKAAEQTQILKSLHNKSDHQSWKETFQRVTDQYWWMSLYKNVDIYICTCKKCQQWSVNQQKKTLFSIWVSVLWQKIRMNVIYILSNQSKHFLMIAWDDLFRWVETRALSNTDSSSVVKFLYKDVICRHSCFDWLVVDDELENKEFVEVLSEKYKIHWLVVSAYHSQANEMIKRDHLFLLMSLSKMSEEDFESWVKNLLAVLWVNRTTIQWSTGLTSYYILYRMNAVLLIELDVLIWHVLSWNKVWTTVNLLTVQVQQIQCRDENLKKVTLHLQRMQLKNKKFFDDNHRIWTEEIKNDDLILLHNTKRDTDISAKLTFCWLELFWILKSVSEKRTFIFEELDSTRMAEMFAENRLKIYQTCKVVIDAISASKNCVNQKTIHNVRRE